MSQWLVTQGNNQFAVDGLGQLKQLAQTGKLRPGDMIQPPGATDWIYAVEIPELKDILSDDAEGDDDDLARRAKSGALFSAIAAVVLMSVLVVGAGTMFMMFQELPTGDEVLIGEGGLTFSEMLVTNEGISLLSGPDANSSPVQSLQKNQTLELLAKRADYYRAKTKGGGEGWVRYDHVIPMYQLGGIEVREEYDPLYNPDRYVEVVNASWQQLPDQTADQITVFQFMMKNLSEYSMTDLVIQATIKDAKGHELEKVEIPIEGFIPAGGMTMVGTLKPDVKGKPKQGEEEEPPRLLTQYTFDKLTKDDPDLQLRYSAGVEVQMSTADFTNANIDIVELRAVPDEAAAEIVTQRE